MIQQIITVFEKGKVNRIMSGNSKGLMNSFLPSIPFSLPSLLKTSKGDKREHREDMDSDE